jgi:S-DNA-T family DNA segregation ATPase FtsK/SpoIIIE
MSTIAYHRRPRAPIPPLPSEAVVIRTPPPAAASGVRSLRTLQLIAPIAGAGTGLAVALAYRQTGALLAVTGAAVGIGVLVSTGTALSQTLAGRAERRGRRRRYLDYLAAQEGAISALIATQREREALLLPDEAGLAALVRQRERIYERRPGDPDWLEVRAGAGSLPPAVRVTLEEIDPLGPAPDPELLAAARALVGRFQSRVGAPLPLSLLDAGTLVLRGPPLLTRGVARSLAVQAAVFHPPADLGIAILTGDATAAEAWEWVKWLPHARTPDDLGAPPSDRPASVGAGPAQAGDILRHLIREPGERPRHLLVVVDGWSAQGGLAELASLRALMRDGPGTGVTVVCTVGSAGDEPGELRSRMALEPDGTATVEITRDVVTGSVVVAAEPLGAAAALSMTRRLAPLRLVPEGETAPGGAGRAAAGLLDALSLGPAARIDVGRAWHGGSGPLLRCPIGTGPQGETVELDLKELSQGGMGPHGMLVGATGSGKSELLRTLVAGLAATHPPDLLAFVLVDFKGGTAFQPMARLPHVAGLITNLEDDPTMVERFRLAIEGELVRRQSLFKAAGGIPDLRAYHRRRTAVPALEPLPHLWLVVDELAELLAAHPDLDQFFEGVARLGRALGIHLLLATQGVSGGLARLDRHLSYRLCLRTNSLQESLLVLGSPLAAQLPPTPGMGYLRVGQGPPRRFRAFLVGEPPHHRDPAPGEGDRAPGVRRFAVIQPPKATPPREVTAEDPADGDRRPSAPDGGGEPTELDLLVERLAGWGAAPAHPVWMTLLPRTLSLDAVVESGARPLAVSLGLADHPLRQRQQRWGIDFGGELGHLAIVGAPRTGRSTALRTVAASLMLTHDPGAVQLYVVDMGGSLQGLVGAPHVGSVAGRADPEVARRIIRLLNRLVDQRDDELRSLGLGGIDELRRSWRERGSSDGFGDVFLLIDGWGTATRAFDWIEEEVIALAGVGLSHGIHLVLSADRWGDLRPALRDRIPARLQLRPIDPVDSAYDLRATRGLAGTPGRALGPGSCQVQLALPRVDGGDPAIDPDTAFRDLVKHRARPGPAAPPVPLLPLTVPLAGMDWGDWHRRREVPLGLADADLRPVAFNLLGEETQHLMVCGDARCGKTSFLRALLLATTRVLSPEEVRFYLVDTRRGLLDALPEAYVAGHAMTASAVEGLVASLREELARRVPPAGASRRELAERLHVRGPEVVLVVDDDDIVDSAALSPLAGAVPLAWEMRFHVILARRPASPGYASLGSALIGQGAAAVEMSEAERSLFVTRPVSLPPGRAQLVVRGRASLVQLIHAEEG